MLKKSRTIFLLIPFSSIKKSKLTNLQKTLHNFFACPRFQILKKVYLQILKKSRTIFQLLSFCNI